MNGKKVTTLSAESIERFRNSYIGKGRSENTARAYTADLREFLRASGETEIPMEEFEELAMSWLNMSRRDVSPKTTGRRLTSLRQFGKWAGLSEVLHEYTAPHPARPVPHPIPEGIRGVERMLKEAKNDDQRALVALCGLVGLRVGEALTIRVQDFNLALMTVSVRGKGDRTRIVPINDRAWPYISSAYVKAFSTRSGRLIKYKDRFARKIITNLGARAGLMRPVASHDLRATFATAAYDHVRDIRAVQELLGHSNSATTEVYTGVSMDKMREAADF